MYMRTRHDYDDQYAREVVVSCIYEVSYVVCLLCFALLFDLLCYLICLAC